jgi:hypothetical protein|uniref:Uncharacterized protein n=1 Tax=Zea mays TaxID=4577 RepID=A0A804N195_MAIZE
MARAARERRYGAPRRRLGAEVHVHPDGDEEDGGEGEEEDGVDEDGDGAGLEVAELDDPALARHLEQQARRQQDEEHQRDEHRRPVLHLRALLIISLCPSLLASFLNLRPSRRCRCLQ